MMYFLKKIGRSVIPKKLFRTLQPIYHGLVAYIATIYFNHPSKKLFVIGVTGTAGKSTTVIMCAQILNFVNRKTGYITTAGSSNGDNAFTNMHGLSMPGGWLMQKQLANMVKKNCEYAIVECTSEGLAQNRHVGINFQGGLFTNLSPAHLDSHGSFENYRMAKGKLFTTLAKNPNSLLGVNLDDPNKNFFLNFKAGKKFGISTRADVSKTNNLITFNAENIEVNDHISFSVKGVQFDLKMFGTFNLTNALLAIGCTSMLNVNLSDASLALSSIDTVPGRMEIIKEPDSPTVIVDYAPEPAAMEASLRSVILIPHKKIVHVFGSTGGHRDVAKRSLFGKISAKFADTILITNDDVYGSNPQVIANDILEGVNQAEKKKVQQVEIILDRKTAITKALQIAEPQDIVLITGKGSEQFLILPDNQRIPWDDRVIVKKLLNLR